MEICVLNPFFYPYMGGTEKVLLEIYSRLARRHNITVISASLTRGGKASVDEVKGIRVVRLATRYYSFPGLPMPFMRMLGVSKAVADEHAQIYHINNRYVYFWNAVRSARDAGGKLAMTIHNSLPKGIGPVTDAGGLAYDLAWGRRLMNEVDVITAVSKNALDTTVPARLRHKSHVIFNGVDHRLFRKISDAKARNLHNKLGGGLVLLNNGRLTWQKGQIFFLDAVARLAKEGVDANSVIIGTGPLRDRLERFARLSGISKRFEVVSGIEEKMMPYYYSAADLFVMPSLYEPAGLALLEALACETPALATNIGGMPEMMGPEGHYIRPKSSDDIYNGIRKFMAERGQFAKAAKGIRARVVKRNDWDKIAKSYETLFESIIKS